MVMVLVLLAVADIDGCDGGDGSGGSGDGSSDGDVGGNSGGRTDGVWCVVQLEHVNLYLNGRDQTRAAPIMLISFLGLPHANPGQCWARDEDLSWK